MARAGVTGTAWLSVWMPGVVVGRESSLLRVAPTTHSGRVLGLIVAVRPPGGDQFTADDDVVLTELARQVGLALHNVELDSALQKSLEDLRLQAEQLQESRARIVAASDAARRQIERNLHDGAQQHLVALAVNVRLARRLAETRPAGLPGNPRPAGRGPAERRPGTACPGPWHLPPAAGGQRHRGSPTGRRRPGRPAHAGRGRGAAPVLARDGGGGLLLLPGGTAKRRQARRAGRQRHRQGLGGAGLSAFRGLRRRRRLRCRWRQGQGRRLCQHGRPGRRHGRDRPGQLRSRGRARPSRGASPCRHPYTARCRLRQFRRWRWPRWPGVAVSALDDHVPSRMSGPKRSLWM